MVIFTLPIFWILVILLIVLLYYGVKIFSKPIKRIDLYKNNYKKDDDYILIDEYLDDNHQM